MVDAPSIPGLQTGAFSQAGNVIGTLANVFSYIVVGGVTILVTFGIFWFLREKVFSFNIPVSLKFEVGGTIQEKKDKIRIRRLKDEWKVTFQKNHRLVAQIPPDECAFFRSAGLREVKTFEGFVRDNQVAWIWPKPQTKIAMANEKGEIIGEHERMVTIPANLIEFQIEESRRNVELTLKKKWWQDPVVIAWAAMGFMVIALIFIYLLYKNVPDQINAYLSFAHTVAQQCGTQIK